MLCPAMKFSLQELYYLKEIQILCFQKTWNHDEIKIASQECRVFADPVFKASGERHRLANCFEAEWFKFPNPLSEMVKKQGTCQL